MVNVFQQQVRRPLLYGPLLFSLMILGSSSAVGETAAPPLLVVGPACTQMPDGPPPVRPFAFVVFEDRNGDGAYDFYIRYGCNGVAYEGAWNPQVQTDPFSDGNGIPIAALPSGTDQVYYDLHYTGSLTITGGYMWTLDEKRVSDNAVVATWKRNQDGSFSYLLHPLKTEKTGKATID